MKVLSLGWGVQSFTIAAMVALGELEPIDVAIHADTKHEASWTYEFASRWTSWLLERGVKVITTSADDTGVINRYGGVAIPVHTDGGGMLHRECTTKWKISTINRYIQANRNKKRVTLSIGISLDEFQRMRDSRVKYIENIYPLIERKMTRKDCEKWLISHGLEVPKKSSCTFCPFHSIKEWRHVKSSENDWRESVIADNQVRNKLRGGLFLTRHCKPLDEIDFRTLQEKGQLEMSWDSECTGMCGV
jgi:hypothetical protein